MIEYPEYIEVNNKKYKINTDFRVALKCNQIAEDEKIGDFERTLAIIYLLFGDEALQDGGYLDEFMKLAQKYLSCGKEIKKPKKNEKPDMDFIEDMDYIEASFQSDFGISLSDEKMHWWKFNKLINGLSNSEFGNCCILNRIRNIRNTKIDNIKDRKEREKIIEAKKQFELSKNKKENNLTKEQEKSMYELDRLLKNRRE